MSDNCRWAGRGNPRTFKGRHEDTCAEEKCDGCLMCLEPHCTVCGVKHAHSACPGCVGDTRETLHEIGKLTGEMPQEALERGVNSQALMLITPTANPEAWRNRASSANMGRVPDGYLEDCRDEQHPLWVLGSWEQMWRDHLEHYTDLRLTLPRAIDYLNQQMSYMGSQLEPPFDEFARELRACRTHLESVAHDQNQGDRANIGCFDCGHSLERKLRDVKPGGPKDDRGGFEDFWTCRGCRRRYTYAEYNFALRASLEENRGNEAAEKEPA